MSKRYGHIHVAMGHLFVFFAGAFALILVWNAITATAVLDDQTSATEAAAAAAK